MLYNLLIGIIYSSNFWNYTGDEMKSLKIFLKIKILMCIYVEGLSILQRKISILYVWKINFIS